MQHTFSHINLTQLVVPVAGTSGGSTLEDVLCVTVRACVCQPLAECLVFLIHLIYCGLHKQQDIKVFEQVLQAPQQVEVSMLPQQSAVGHGAKKHLPQLLPTTVLWCTHANTVVCDHS